MLRTHPHSIPAAIPLSRPRAYASAHRQVARNASGRDSSVWFRLWVAWDRHEVQEPAPPFALDTGSKPRCFQSRPGAAPRNTRGGQRVNNRMSQRTGSGTEASISLAVLCAWLMRMLYSRPSVITLGTRRTAVRPSRSHLSPNARAVVTSSASQPGSADGDRVSITTLSGIAIRTT